MLSGAWKADAWTATHGGCSSAFPWRWRNRSWWQQGCGCHSDVPTCRHLGREHMGSLADAFPKQAVVSSGTCHQRPAVTVGCAAAGRRKHTGLSCAVIENTSPRSSGRGAVGWDGRTWVPLSSPGPLPSVRALQCLSVAQEDMKFNGCPEIIISGKHSLISVCLAGFYCLPFLRAPLCPDPFSQFMSSSFHPSFASHPFWLLLHLCTQGSPLWSL